MSKSLVSRRYEIKKIIQFCLMLALFTGITVSCTVLNPDAGEYVLNKVKNESQPGRMDSREVNNIKQDSSGYIQSEELTLLMAKQKTDSVEVDSQPSDREMIGESREVGTRMAEDAPTHSKNFVSKTIKKSSDKQNTGIFANLLYWLGGSFFTSAVIYSGIRRKKSQHEGCSGCIMILVLLLVLLIVIMIMGWIL